jgi:hypothetical protein
MVGVDAARELAREVENLARAVAALEDRAAELES